MVGRRARGEEGKSEKRRERETCSRKSNGLKEVGLPPKRTNELLGGYEIPGSCITFSCAGSATLFNRNLPSLLQVTSSMLFRE